jgi:hypothetical protein
MSTFDRFDVAEAYFLWLVLHHVGVVSGRSDPRWWCSYNRLSTMCQRLSFRPAANLSLDTLTDNSRQITPASVGEPLGVPVPAERRATTLRKDKRHDLDLEGRERMNELNSLLELARVRAAEHAPTHEVAALHDLMSLCWGLVIRAQQRHAAVRFRERMSWLRFEDA